MPKIAFTRNLAKRVHCPEVAVAADTVRDALESVFASNSELRKYVLDSRGSLRSDMVIFIDDKVICDRETLSDRVTDRSELFVMQALAAG